MQASLKPLFAAITVTLSAVSAADHHAMTDTPDENLAVAERMIDAFYAFDPSQLQPLLSAAGDAEGAILDYQAWAEGGNYKVLNRKPCAYTSANIIACSITVQDDPVLALETGFNVTDTFHITVEEGVIVGVETSSDDQPIYFEARDWVAENLPDVMSGPCLRVDGRRQTPGDCARAMTEGYRQFTAARKAAAK